jgi:hypothetical protein
MRLAGIREQEGIRPANMIAGRLLLHAGGLGEFRQVLGICFRKHGRDGFKDLLHEVLLLGGQWP